MKTSCIIRIQVLAIESYRKYLKYVSDREMEKNKNNPILRK